MIILSGYGDEISPNLDEQLDVLEQEGISYLDLRSVGSVTFPPVSNMLELTGKELAQIKKRINERCFKVNSLNSPVGKSDIKEDFTLQLQKFMRSIELANYFGTRNVRVFSFFIPKGEQPWKYRKEVLSRLKQLTRIAEREGIILMLENEANLYGSNGERLRDIFESIPSPHLRLAFDPANFVQSQVLPMTDAYPYVEPYIAWVQVKDALINDGKSVPIGTGDGQIRSLLHKLKTKHYSNTISVESKLEPEGKLAGMTRAQLYRLNVKALKTLMKEEGLRWK